MIYAARQQRESDAKTGVATSGCTEFMIWTSTISQSPRTNGGSLDSHPRVGRDTGDDADDADDAIDSIQLGPT
jgi:hypothetical protein